MSDRPVSEDNSSQHPSKGPSAEHSTAPHATDPAQGSPDKKSEVIKEKFLTVAKEKNQLEDVIMRQNDMIKDLEKEKANLTLSIRKFAESHKKMKEKLLDFDILRNMEISDLKKKIRYLMAENKKLLSEKEFIIKSIGRDQKNIARLDGHTDHDMPGEAAPPVSGEGHDLFRDRAGHVDDELLHVGSQLKETELDRDEARAELYNARVELDNLRTDKARAEEELQRRIREYSSEISELRVDIDELTSAMEDKIHGIDELNAKVGRLSEELSHKDTELHEKIPALLEKINSLSQSIDTKMEENSLFAKELFDLNVKISFLNDELIRKDELLIEISEDYKKQKEEIEALRDKPAVSGEDLAEAVRERQALEARLADALARIAGADGEISGLRSSLEEKDRMIAGLRDDVSRLVTDLKLSGEEHGKVLSGMQEKVFLLNQLLLEKNELLTVMSSEHSQEKDRLDSLLSSAERDRSMLHQEIDRLRSEVLDHEKEAGEYRAAISSLGLEKSELEVDIAAATEKISDLAVELDRVAALSSQKDASLSQAAEEAAGLREALGVLEKNMSEKEDSAGRGQADRDELIKKSAEYEEAFEALKQEIISLNKKLAEKEQIVAALISDKERLSGDLAAMQAQLDQALTEALSLKAGRAEKEDYAEEERHELLSALAGLKDQLNSLSRAKEEDASALRDELSAYGQAVADLRLKFEATVRENADLKSELNKAMEGGAERPSPAAEMTEVTLPVRLVSGKKMDAAPKHRSLVFSLLALVLLAFISLSFYAYNTGLFSQRGQKQAERKELTHNEMFSILTRTSSPDNELKFQATLITEPLVVKSDSPADKGLFNFQDYLYFKVTVSSPKKGLDRETVDAPEALITLSSSSGSLKPLADRKVKDYSVFYRKEEPVSVTFYTVFRKNDISSDIASMTLSFAGKTGKADLVWDLMALKSSGITP